MVEDEEQEVEDDIHTRLIGTLMNTIWQSLVKNQVQQSWAAPSLRWDAIGIECFKGEVEVFQGGEGGAGVCVLYITLTID